MQGKSLELTYNYKKESKNQSYDDFWGEMSGDFDKDDKTHVSFMLRYVIKELNLDEYATKRLEATIKTELPFFAQKRLLARKWLLENFNY